MTLTCFTSRKLAIISLVLALPVYGWAQAPVITSVLPAANARAVARNSPLTVSFSQALTPASGLALKVFSAQRGGLRTQAAPAVTSGSTLRYTPAYPFMAGEKVAYSVTQDAASAGGTLTQPRVGQFTTAVRPGGNANFLAGVSVGVAASPWAVAVGDVDNDGDLDLLAAAADNSSSGITGTVSVRINNGQGIFSGSQEVSVGRDPQGISLGDFDGDGALDFVTVDYNSSTLTVCLNDGSGNFNYRQAVRVGFTPSNVLTADVDGDGDLDLVVPYLNGTTISVHYNQGNGLFTNSQLITVGYNPTCMAVGDVDADGDLDLVVGHGATYMNASKISVCLNSGSGQFTVSQSLPISTDPWDATIGDIDGDGDLDLLLANFTSSSTVSVRRNNGSGVFSGNQEVVAYSPFRLTVGDVDGDGDLDLVEAAYSQNRVAVQLNDGRGNFSPRSTIYLAGTQNLRVAVGVTLGDVDGDGDLDLLGSSVDNTISVHLNNGTALAASQPVGRAGLTVYPTPVLDHVMLSGAAPNAPLTLLDALGRVCLTARADASGQARFQLPAALPGGVYTVRSGGQVSRLVVE